MMHSKQSEMQDRLISSRDNYRSEIRKLDHLAMLKTRRALIIRSRELRDLFEHIGRSRGALLSRALFKLEEETADGQHLQLLMETLTDYSQDFHSLYLVEQQAEHEWLLPTKLKVLINLTTQDSKVLQTDIVLAFLNYASQRQNLELALTAMRNMLLSKSYCEETEAYILRSGWLRKLPEFKSSLMLEVLSVMAGMPRTQAYLRERVLDMCLMFRLSLAAIMQGDEEQLASAYHIVVELLELNSNYRQQLTKEELGRMLVQLTYSPPNAKNYAGNILAALSLYTQDRMLAERFANKQGLKAVFGYLALNNINNRKGASVILLNCSQYLSQHTEMMALAASLLFTSRLLYMQLVQLYRLQNDTFWVTSTIMEILRNLIQQYEKDFVDSLVEAGILSILLQRMMASEDRQQKSAIAALLSVISRKSRIKFDLASIIDAKSAFQKDPDDDSNSGGGFYGCIYKQFF